MGETPVFMPYLWASCEADPATDAAGNPVNYVVENVTDGNPATAWRCPGSAQSQYIEFTIDKHRTEPVSDVGIIPGYAKIDLLTKVDRFTDNHTVTRVRWEFTDGRQWTQFEQVIDDPKPVMTWLHLPTPVDAVGGRVVITQSGNPSAFWDFTAVSEVELYGPEPVS